MPRTEDLAPLFGYEISTTEEKLRKRSRHRSKGGDWRKWRIIHNLEVREVIRSWTCSSSTTSSPPLRVTSIVPIGMVGCAQKVFTASSRNFTTLPTHVENNFNIKSKQEF